MRTAATRGLLCLLLGAAAADWTPPELRHVPQLRPVPLRGDDGLSSSASLGVFVAEEWSDNPVVSSDEGRSIEVMGSHRAYLAQDPHAAAASAGIALAVTTWREIWW